MKRFLSLLAGGLVLPATIVTSSQAQIKFEGLKLTNSGGSYTLQGPATGTGTYIYPSLAGASGTLLTSDAGQSILGQLSLGLNGASGVAGKLSILDGLNAGSTGNITWGSGLFTVSGGISTPAVTISSFGSAGIVHNTGAGVLSTSAINLAGGSSEVSGLLPGTNGGTGVNNGTNTLTLSGGNFTFTTAAGSSVTVPASGTLLSDASALTSSATPGLSLTSATPKIQVTDTKGVTITDGTNNLVTITDAGTTGALSVNAVTVGGLTASRVVKTDGSSGLTTGAVNLASSNEVTGLLAGTNGGTGVNNGTNTLTLSGGNFTFTTAAGSSVTVPASGTLLSDASALTSSATPGLSLTSATPKIQVTNTAGLLVTDGTNNLVTITDAGTTGTLTVNNLRGSADVAINTTNVVTNSRLAIKDGHWQSSQTTAPTAAPITAQLGSGSTAVLANATDVAGKITLQAGGGPAAGNVATVTFNLSYSGASTPIVVLTPVTALAVARGAYISAVTATTFTIAFSSAPANNDVMTYYYHVIETQ